MNDMKVMVGTPEEFPPWWALAIIIQRSVVPYHSGLFAGKPS
jgi:hypothetical protein